jgi:poly(3-hydroxyalkanoate) synthetase
VIPPQITQSFFAMRDLSSGANKFRRFALLDPASAEAKRFVAVEDWLNDGVPLAPPVGRECFLEWITDNALAKGAWSPCGSPFEAAEITHPALVVSAQRDTVVRRAASEPLADVLPDARLLKAPVGHIGMVVGAGALDEVWRPVKGFLLD